MRANSPQTANQSYMKLTAFSIILVITFLLQGCIVGRVVTAPIRYGLHRAEIARAEKRGERRAEKRSEKAAEDRAPAPSHIDRSELPPPPAEAPAN